MERLSEAFHMPIYVVRLVIFLYHHQLSLLGEAGRGRGGERGSTFTFGYHMSSIYLPALASSHN